jgi:hypothetical protein
VWVERHPEAESIGLAYTSAIDYRILGAEYERVPTQPLPGWFGVDVRNLMDPSGRYQYFLLFRPVAKAGYSIFIYHITPDEADRVRRSVGFPPLTSAQSP